MHARHVVMLTGLSLIWGGSYLLIKFAARDISEAWVVLLRAGLAGISLWLFIQVVRRDLRPQLRQAVGRPWPAVLLGFSAIGGPFVLITYGERTVPSGLTAVLIASAPIFIALMAPFLDAREVMGTVQWIGLAVGIAGVGLLVGVEQLHSAGALLGALAMLGAAALYGYAGFVLTRFYHGISPIVTSCLSTSTAAILVIPLALIHRPTQLPGGLAIFSIVMLGTVMTAFAFMAYYGLIAEIGVGKASIVAYTIPPVALVYGVVLLDEVISPAMLFGMGLILAGVFLVVRGPSRNPAANAPTEETFEGEHQTPGEESPPDAQTTPEAPRP